MRAVTIPYQRENRRIENDAAAHFFNKRKRSSNQAVAEVLFGENQIAQKPIKQRKGIDCNLIFQLRSVKVKIENEKDF